MGPRHRRKMGAAVSLVNAPLGASPHGRDTGHQVIGEMALPGDTGQPLPSVPPLMAQQVHEGDSHGGKDGHHAWPRGQGRSLTKPSSTDRD